MTYPTVTISRRAAYQIRNGYLWIYSNEIDMRTMPEAPGTWCFFASDNQQVAFGYCNRHSLIAGRVCAVTAPGSLAELLEERLTHAFSHRAQLWEKCGSARMLFSESDLLPGIIIDAYGSLLVVQSNTAGIDAVTEILETLIPQTWLKVFGTPVSGLVIRGDAGMRQYESIPEYVKIPLGDAQLLEAGSFSEYDVTYAADFVNGQKTGFFLDQRDNRAYLGSLISTIPQARVLDLCCYSGGWGLRALKAGAAQVTFMDQSETALAQVKRGAELNGFSPSRYTCIADDVFDFLQKCSDQYDVIIADPPAFVKSRKKLPVAMAAYEKLNRHAWRKLGNNGVLITCSCSHHISAEDFSQVVQSAVAKEKGIGQIIYTGRQPEDHPSLVSMPETAYLKCLAVRKV